MGVIRQLETLVFISAHCIPTTEFWLSALTQPPGGEYRLTCSCQMGIETSKFSEKQLLKYFPSEDAMIPQRLFL
jgi:hypothetical protein